MQKGILKIIESGEGEKTEAELRGLSEQGCSWIFFA